MWTKHMPLKSFGRNNVEHRIHIFEVVWGRVNLNFSYAFIVEFVLVRQQKLMAIKECGIGVKSGI